MAIASTTVFEVRPGAGSATNGGGFVPGSSGTDWSQQNAAQYSVTDGVANGTTTVTSATAAFGTDVVGNIVFIGGAWYQIVSRTNGTTIVVDRAITAATGLTLKIGGALDLCATAEPLLTAGMTLWIKVGTQTLTNPIVLSNSGDSTNGPISWKGYDQVRGDHTANRPLITTSTNNKDLLQGALAGTNFRAWDNINWSSTAGTPAGGITAGTNANASFWFVSNCKISGCKYGIAGDLNTYGALLYAAFVNVEITGCTNHGVFASGNLEFSGCYIHGNTGKGIDVPAQPFASGSELISVENSVIYSNAGGIYVEAAAGQSNIRGAVVRLRHSAIVSNTADGINNAIANGNLSIVSLENAIIYGNGGWGVNLTNPSGIVSVNRNNAYGSNTSGDRNNLAAGTSDVSLSADPFTAKGSHNFSLNSTAGGGAACKAVGFPGSIAGLVTTGFADIGALQSAAPAAVNVFPAPRRITVQGAARPLRRPGFVIPCAPVPLRVPGRRRDYPVHVPSRRSSHGNLFAAPQSILVTSPRKVR